MQSRLKQFGRCTFALALASSCQSKPTEAPSDRAEPKANAKKAATVDWPVHVLPSGLGPVNSGYGSWVQRGKPWGWSGQLRFQSVGGRLEVATELPEYAIQQMLPAADGVVIYSGSGQLYWASSFLGALTPFTGEPVELYSVAVAKDRVLGCDAEGQMWSADLSSVHALHRQEQACRRIIAGDDVAVVLDLSGQVLRSTDRGRTFAPVDLGGARAENIWWDSDGVTITCDDDGGDFTPSFELLPDGKVIPTHEFRDHDDPEPTTHLPQDEYDKIERAAKASFAPLLASLFEPHDETGACARRQDRSLCPEGVSSESIPDAKCGAVRTTQRTHVTVCAHESESQTVVYELRAGRWTQVVAWPSAGPIERAWPAVVGDRKDVVVAGPCEPSGPTPKNEELPIGSLCWFDGQTSRTVAIATNQLPVDSSHPSKYDTTNASLPVGLHDHWLLLGSQINEAYENLLGGADAYRFVDLTGGHESFPVDYDALGHLNSPPEFVGDELIAVAITNDGTRLVATRPGEPHEIRPLPQGAYIFSFADAEHGIAAGKHAGQLWWTTDRGRSWQPLEVPVDGDPTSVEIGQARCSNVACGAIPFVWLDPLMKPHVPTDEFRVVAR